MYIKLGSRAVGFILAATVFAICFAPAAVATPVTYNFTVDVTGGPLAGVVENGSFSYDSSSIIPGGFNSAYGLLTAFDFTFNGTTYDSGTANTGLLGFDSAGALTSFAISSSCTSLGCTFAHGTDNFRVTQFATNGFVYSTATFDDYAYGDVSFSRAGGVAVPEPGAFGLFGFGLLLLGVVVRRRSVFRRLPG